MRQWSKDDVARIIINGGREAGITPRGIVIGLAVGLVESGLTVYANAKVPGSLQLPHDAVGSDGYSVGVQQQQVVKTNNGYWWGPVEVCQDPVSSTRLFFQRLKRLDYEGPGTPGSYAQTIQQSAYPDRYDQRMGDAQALYDRITKGSAVPDNRPDFNEFAKWCNNTQGRGSTDVDLWLLHTQEGGGGDSAAEDLANFLISTEGGPNPVSYHYTGSQASDGGVTIVDVVDTDLASWSVGNSNNRAINFCFAGSSTNWTRAQWLKQAKVIDVAAYLFVQDCAKYPKLQSKVIAPDYSSPPGAADHKYCTEFLKDGNNHTDVGPNFPWDVFKASVSKYAAGGPIPGQPQPDPGPPPFQYPSEADMVKQTWEQLFGPQAGGWPQLGGRTLVDAVAELLKDKP